MRACTSLLPRQLSFPPSFSLGPATSPPPPARAPSEHNLQFAPPKTPGVDDLTGEPLIKRKDDNAETLKSRLAAFHAQTAPVIQYFKDKVVTIKADRGQEEVAQQVRKALT